MRDARRWTEYAQNQPSPYIWVPLLLFVGAFALFTSTLAIQALFGDPAEYTLCRTSWA
ncbi:MAG: hypothetical protein M5R40_13860 [Anaerolineae bacterium]|nr:hypothetical protein [Anaerolineae bacterium]